MFNALSPFYIVAALIVLLMLAAAFVRNHKFIAGISAVGLLAALVTVIFHCNCPIPDWASNLMELDKLSWLFLGISIISAIFINILSYFYFAKHEEQKEEYYVLLNTALFGTMVMVSSNHFMSFFLGLELLSIPLFVMIAYLRNRASSTEAAIKYLTLSGASSAALLFGFALIYAGSGEMSLMGLANYFRSTIELPIYLLVGIGLFIASMGFKLALAPFHMWTADVYQASPAPVTAFLASIAKGGAMVFLIRFFDAALLSTEHSVYFVLGILAAFSMFTGNLLAIWQNNVKRILAFSSISHMGYLMIVVIAGTEAAINSAIFYLASYFITSIAAFGVIAVLSEKEEIEKSENFKGLYYRYPLLGIVFSVALLSLAGMPLTAGFIAKILVAYAGGGANLWWLVVLLVLNSGIGLFYYIKIVSLIYKKDESSQDVKVRIPVLASIALAILLIAIVALGVAPGGLMSLM